ncbi:hypothetical protein SAMN06295974_3757 [Plantibacter flavus]|uniref:Uncharacterized protein n=1 Tax=Plantibacter flavus TaxID=150123 RepID=A0A3N2BLF3_9MICO|nr:hypothetical protein [Plantibacter flavus]ROR76095.1 hypothetical protein EDD42_4048 [Plantibacter flavus]SMG48582.1 hypothetical protein SAMN06295974_3757 [Plantibacter flavus]
MSLTTINITVREGRVPPVRKRINIPASDITTQTWWENQVDVSTSIRLLILEEVKRHGVVDRLNRIGTDAMATHTAPAAAPRVTVVTGAAATPAPAAATTTPATPASAPVMSRDEELDLLRAENTILRSVIGPVPALFDVNDPSLRGDRAAAPSPAAQAA